MVTTKQWISAEFALDSLEAHVEDAWDDLTWGGTQDPGCTRDDVYHDIAEGYIQSRWAEFTDHTREYLQQHPDFDLMIYRMKQNGSIRD